MLKHTCHLTYKTVDKTKAAASKQGSHGTSGYYSILQLSIINRMEYSILQCKINICIEGYISHYWAEKMMHIIIDYINDGHLRYRNHVPHSLTAFKYVVKKKLSKR